MQASELAARAVRVLSGDAPFPPSAPASASPRPAAAPFPAVPDAADVRKV
ncbi:hypothetical protein [Streptomyces sp. MMS24-I29]